MLIVIFHPTSHFLEKVEIRLLLGGEECELDLESSEPVGGQIMR